MVRILDPELHIEAVDGHPGRRRLVVSYRLDVPANDPALGHWLHEEVVVHARDEHDAPVLPSPIEFHLAGDADALVPGSLERRLEREVVRVDLDVEQDWWDTDQAGGTLPIAEFADHLVAEIEVRARDHVVASAVTPTVTGSWGALGAD